MERGRDSRYSRNKRRLAAYVWSARLTCCSRRGARSSHEYRDLRGRCVARSATRELTDGRRERNETKHTGARRPGSAILGEQNLSENSTIGIAVGSAFVRRGTIDENAPQNSWTRRRVDFDVRPGITGELELAKRESPSSINIVL